MRYEPDDVVAGKLKMLDISCRCGSECRWKSFDPNVQWGVQTFFERIAEALDKYGEPYWIQSGLRCPEHNKDPRVGGSKNSAHLYGAAVDVAPDGPMGPLVYGLERMGCFGGILVYPAFRRPTIHVDMHPSGRMVRGVSYKPNGDNHWVQLGKFRGEKIGFAPGGCWMDPGGE